MICTGNRLLSLIYKRYIYLKSIVNQNHSKGVYPKIFLQISFYIYMEHFYTHTDSSPKTTHPLLSTLNPNFLFYYFLQMNQMQYMDHLDLEDVESICYIEEGSNNVIIKFYGFTTSKQSELFSVFAMKKLDFDYIPNDEYRNKSIHQIWILKSPIHQESNRSYYTNKLINIDGVFQSVIEDSAKLSA